MMRWDERSVMGEAEEREKKERTNTSKPVREAIIPPPSCFLAMSILEQMAAINKPEDSIYNQSLLFSFVILIKKLLLFLLLLLVLKQYY